MLRILDANLNRASEGLRLLEDISRFVLDDAVLSEQLKSLRHDLLPTDPLLQEKLIGARRSDEDTGAFLDIPGEGERADNLSLVNANCRRVQQSLRVLEETLKTPGHDLALDWRKYKRARFTIYEIQKTLASTLLRRQRAEGIAGLYVIIDAESLNERNLVEVTQQAIRGGARVIQLRDKLHPAGKLISVAGELSRICAGSGVLFVVNDDIDIAIASDADGVHLGQDDLPVPVARKQLPAGKIIGCSAATLEEALQAQDAGADYIAVGSIYPTKSKSITRPAGIETLRAVKQHVSLPVVAIGGINTNNVDEVIDAGADAVAVISAVLGAENIEEAARRLTYEMKGCLNDQTDSKT